MDARSGVEVGLRGQAAQPSVGIGDIEALNKSDERARAVVAQEVQFAVDRSAGVEHRLTVDDGNAAVALRRDLGEIPGLETFEHDAVCAFDLGILRDVDVHRFGAVGFLDDRGRESDRAALVSRHIAVVRTARRPGNGHKGGSRC